MLVYQSLFLSFKIWNFSYALVKPSPGNSTRLCLAKLAKDILRVGVKCSVRAFLRGVRSTRLMLENLSVNPINMHESLAGRRLTSMVPYQCYISGFPLMGT